MKSVLDILKACREGKINFLKKLIESGQSLEDVKDSNDKTVLHYCMENKEIACAEIILKSWPQCLDSQDSVGITPLHLATVLNNTKMIDFLITEGADVQIADKEKHTAVHWAVVYAQVEALKLLLKQGARVNDADTHEAYPLHYAAQGCGTQDLEVSSVEIITELIRAGADPNCLDSLHRTPLHWAVTVGSEKGSEKLIEMGSLLHCADTAGMQPIHCAASKGFTKLLTQLVVDHRSQIDPPDKNGCTPLFYATSNGHQSTVDELIHLKAKLDHQDSKGRTSVHCAASKNERKVFDKLIENGANPWIQNESGDTPLHEACFVGNQEMIQALVKHSRAKENIDTPNYAGQTALHIAAAKQNSEALKTLIDHGADVNKLVTLQDGSQLTALNLVKGIPDCERILLSAGARSVSDVNDESSRIGSVSKLNKIEEDPDPDLDQKQESESKDNQATKKKHKKTKKDTQKKEENKENVEIHEVHPVISSGVSSKLRNSSSGSENSVRGSQSEGEKRKDSHGKKKISNKGVDKTDFENHDRKRSSSSERKDDKKRDRKRSSSSERKHTKKGDRKRSSSSERKDAKNHDRKRSSSSERKIVKDRECESQPTKSKSRGESSERKNSEEVLSKSFPKGKESAERYDRMKKKKKNVPQGKSTKRSKSTTDVYSPRLNQMRDLKDRNQRVSREISRQVHISVYNFEYTRFTARAISEYGRQMIRANLPTCTKGFPIFPPVNLKKKSSRRKRRQPVEKSASYSTSGSRDSSRSSSSSPSSRRSCSSSEDETIREKHINSRSTESKKDSNHAPARPQTSMAKDRRQGRKNESAIDGKRPMTNSNKRVRSAYAPFLPTQ